MTVATDHPRTQTPGARPNGARKPEHLPEDDRDSPDQPARGRDRDDSESPQRVDVSGGEGSVHTMRARHAQVAAQQALKEAASDLLNAADVRALVRRYPWAAVGSAAAVGFLAASVAIPSPSKRAEKRLRALERALQDEAAMSGRSVRASTGKTSRLLRLGLRLGKPMLMSMLTSAATGAAAAAGMQQQGNGQSHGPSYGPANPPPADPSPDVT